MTVPNPDARPVDGKRWRDAIERHLEDLPRQYAALEHAMASFGENFDVQQFKAAYNTSEDMDAYNRVQAVERALGRVQNYVGELAEAGVELAALPRAADSHGSSAQQAFEAMRDAKIITAEPLPQAGAGPGRPDTNRAQLRPDAGRRRASRGDPRAGHSPRLHRLLPGLDRAVPRGTRALTGPAEPSVTRTRDRRRRPPGRSAGSARRSASSWSPRGPSSAGACASACRRPPSASRTCGAARGR